VSFIDELIGLRAEVSEASDSRGRRPRMRGLTLGRVVNLLDPLMLGRVQVRVPSIDGLDLFPFARVVTPGASFFSGLYWIPNLEDEVLVMFEDGDPDAAYILGAVWSAVHMPPMPSPLPQVRTIRSPLGSQVVFTEVPPMLVLQSGPTPPVAIPSPPSPVGPHQTIAMNALGIQIIGGPTVTITSGPNVVSLGPQGVTIATPMLNVVAGGSILSMGPAGITMLGAQISLLAAGEVGLVAGGVASVTAGGAVAVTAGAAVTVTAAAAVTVTGGAAVLLVSAAGVLQSSPTTGMIPMPLK
jgi:hypothetical protein